jgi:hypothetical protein
MDNKYHFYEIVSELARFIYQNTYEDMVESGRLDSVKVFQRLNKQKLRRFKVLKTTKSEF